MTSVLPEPKEVTVRSTAHEPLLMHNIMRITEGHLDAFAEAIDDAVTFVEQHGPQLMVQCFIDEDAMVAHSFQLYQDSAAIRRHWNLSDPYIREVMEHCQVERLEMYGEPDQEVTQQLQQMTPDAVVRSTVPRRIGFLRNTKGHEEDDHQ